MSAAEKKAALAEQGSTGRLSKAYGIVTDYLAKAGEPWNPKGRSNAPENPKSSPIEPSVTPAGKHVPQNVMGGDAKRPVGEGTTMGGWEKLEEDETDGQTHGPVGGERIKRAKNKAAKGRVEHDSSTEEIEDELDKSFAPTDSRDYSGADDNGDAEEDAPEDGGEGGEADASPQDAAAPRDGDAGVAPELAQLLIALEQNPQLIQTLLAAISGGAAAPAAQMGAPALGGAPIQQPAPAGPPQPPANEQLARSMAAHQAALEQQVGADPRAGELAEAMDAAPVLEALIDFQNAGFAKSFALLEGLQKSLVSQAKRIAFLEEGMKKSLTANAAMVEQMLEQAEAAETMQKSMAALSAQPVRQPAVGIHVVPQASGRSSRTIAPGDKRRLEKSLMAAASEGNDRAATLLGVVGENGGLEYVAERMTDELWKSFAETE